MQLIINQEATVWVMTLKCSYYCMHAIHTCWHAITCSRFLAFSLSHLTHTNTHRHTRTRTHAHTQELFCFIIEQRWYAEVEEREHKLKNYTVNYSDAKSVERAIKFAKYIKSTWWRVCLFEYLQAAWVNYTQEATEYLLRTDTQWGEQSLKNWHCVSPTGKP